MKRSAWTREEIDAHRRWHEGRMRELDYPPAIVAELAAAREDWLATIPLRRLGEGAAPK